MSRFYGDLTGQAKTTATRRGSAASGIRSHTRGWNTGVSVDGSLAFHEEDDRFVVYVTGGSHGARRSIHLATIEECRDGSVRVRLGEDFGGSLYDLTRGLIEPGPQPESILQYSEGDF